MKKRKRKVQKNKVYWSVPCANISIRLANSSLKLLEEAAEAKQCSATQLARLYIEQGLGLPKPGMFNKDYRIWPDEVWND